MPGRGVAAVANLHDQIPAVGALGRANAAERHNAPAVIRDHADQLAELAIAIRHAHHNPPAWIDRAQQIAQLDQQIGLGDNADDNVIALESITV